MHSSSSSTPPTVSSATFLHLSSLFPLADLQKLSLDHRSASPCRSLRRSADLIPLHCFLGWLSELQNNMMAVRTTFPLPLIYDDVSHFIHSNYTKSVIICGIYQTRALSSHRRFRLWIEQIDTSRCMWESEWQYGYVSVYVSVHVCFVPLPD